MTKVESVRHCKCPEYHRKVVSSVCKTELLKRLCFQEKKKKVVSSHYIVKVVVIYKSKSVVAPISASLSNFSGILLIKKYPEYCLAVYNKKDSYFLL